MNRTLRKIAAVACLCMPLVAHAGVLYDNGAPEPNAGNTPEETDGFITGGTTTTGLKPMVFDDFVVSSKSLLTDFHFWTLEISPRDQCPQCIRNPLPTWGYASDTLTYAIWSDASGTPGSELATGTLTPNEVTRTDVGDKEMTLHGVLHQMDLYAYDFDLITPLLVDVGRYWFGIYMGDDPTDIYWARTVSVNTDSASQGIVTLADDRFTNVNASTGFDHAFYVTGEKIPAPGALLLLGIGLLLMRGLRKLS